MNSNVIFPISFQRNNRINPVEKILYIGRDRKERIVIVERKNKPKDKDRLLDIEI